MLTNIPIDSNIVAWLQAQTDEKLIKERKGGRNTTLKYISGSTVNDILNTAFGYAWNWQIKREWIQESIPYFNCFSKLKEEKVWGTNGKQGIWENQGPVAHVLGVLTIPLRDKETGEITIITKEAYGSKSIVGNQSDQESIFKAASTDALKKAASLLGIGLDLYRDEEEQLFFNDLVSYMNPIWTEEIKEQYSKELNYIYNLNLPEQELYDIICLVSETEDFLSPDNIEAVYEELVNRYSENTNEEEEE